MYRSALLENVEVQELLFRDNCYLETIGVIFLGSVELDSSLASIFHGFYSLYDLNVVSVAIGYLCPLIESNFIMGLE